MNGQLNATYIAFSKEGQALKLRQTTQDENANAQDAAILASRACAKASSFYQNSNWDLVDACANKKIDLAKVDPKKLPEAMLKMSVEQRQTYVAKLAAERATLQQKILKLGDERKAFIATERKRLGSRFVCIRVHWWLRILQACQSSRGSTTNGHEYRILWIPERVGEKRVAR